MGVGPHANKKMMDSHELDKVIDRAARELIAREPSRALSYKVMARVRRDDVSASRGGWLKAACVCAAGIVVAYLAINRPTPEMQSEPTPHVARTEPAPVSPRSAELPEELRAESRPRPRSRRVEVATRAPIMLPPAPNDVAPIEPIQADPISVSPIEVPQLAREATSIENITIEPLTIEPLTASND